MTTTPPPADPWDEPSAQRTARAVLRSLDHHPAHPLDVVAQRAQVAPEAAAVALVVLVEAGHAEHVAEGWRLPRPLTLAGALRANAAAAIAEEDATPPADSVDELAALPAAVRARLAAVLAAYDEACETWSDANDEQNDAPSVKDAEHYSDALESCAHDFAAVLRDLVEGPATAGPVDVDAVHAAAVAELVAEVEAAGITRHEVEGLALDTLQAIGKTCDRGDVADLVAVIVGRLGIAQARDTIEEATGRELAAAPEPPAAADLARGIATARAVLAERAAEDAQHAAAVAELVAAVDAAGIEPEELDEAVHEAHSRNASGTNNAGTADQVRDLVDAYGTDQARQVIEEATGRSLTAGPADVAEQARRILAAVELPAAVVVTHSEAEPGAVLVYAAQRGTAVGLPAAAAAANRATVALTAAGWSTVPGGGPLAFTAKPPTA